MIHIKYGEVYSDCTCPYEITTDNETVREFVNEWLTTEPHEWGYFSIMPVEGEYSLSNYLKHRYECEHGKIISDPIPEKYLDSKIRMITGSGGYTNSDFELYIKE